MDRSDLERVEEPMDWHEVFERKQSNTLPHLTVRYAARR
jgi:hypothetical protein